jgi:hypothetical protein
VGAVVAFFQSQENPWQPPRTLAPEQVAYFRQVLAIHANQLDSGVCMVCGLASCPDWRAAYDQLAIAGELMGEPEQWATEGRSDPWSR